MEDLQLVYVLPERFYVKEVLEDRKVAPFVVVGALKDGRKVVLAVDSRQQESKDSCAGASGFESSWLGALQGNNSEKTKTAFTNGRV